MQIALKTIIVIFRILVKVRHGSSRLLMKVVPMRQFIVSISYWCQFPRRLELNLTRSERYLIALCLLVTQYCSSELGIYGACNKCNVTVNQTYGMCYQVSVIHDSNSRFQLCLYIYIYIYIKLHKLIKNNLFCV